MGMLSHLPSDRPTIADALKAPLFWTMKDCADFLHAHGEALSKVDRMSSLASQLEMQKDSVFSGNWVNQLPRDLKECLTENLTRAREKARKKERRQGRTDECSFGGGYNPNSLVSLLVFARNALAHPDPENPSHKELFTKSLLNTFPNLLMVVYEYFNVASG